MLFDDIRVLCVVWIKTHSRIVTLSPKASSCGRKPSRCPLEDGTNMVCYFLAFFPDFVAFSFFELSACLLVSAVLHICGGWEV